MARKTYRLRTNSMVTFRRSAQVTEIKQHMSYNSLLAGEKWWGFRIIGFKKVCNTLAVVHKTRVVTIDNWWLLTRGLKALLCWFGTGRSRIGHKVRGLGRCAPWQLAAGRRRLRAPVPAFIHSTQPQLILASVLFFNWFSNIKCWALVVRRTNCISIIKIKSQR